MVASSNALMSTEPGGISRTWSRQAPRFRRRPKPLPATRPACRKSPFVWSVRNPPWESPPSQGHRQNTARHAACQLRPAQRQRAEALCWKLAARWLGAKEDGSEATVKIKGQTPAKEGQG
ncbi:MAG: hypothetical protein ACLSAH_21680 [Bilophila wadsworthia]